MSKKHPQTKQADTSAKERLSGLARSFDDDATALASETLVADTLKIAVGYWLTYPMCFKSIMANPGVTFDQKYLALHSLDTAHSWAVRYLMREAASHGLDGANLWEGGRVCRELHEINPPGILMRLGAIEGGQWPNCLGDTRYKLPQAQQDAICDADTVFMSLMNVLDFPRPPANSNTYEPKIDAPAVPPEVSEPSERQRTILKTMLDENITSERRRKRQAEIVRLINRTHKSASYARDFAELVRRGYLQAREGPQGGTWIDPKRKSEAEQVLKDD